MWLQDSEKRPSALDLYFDCQYFNKISGSKNTGVGILPLSSSLPPISVKYVEVRGQHCLSSSIASPLYIFLTQSLSLNL